MKKIARLKNYKAEIIFFFFFVLIRLPFLGQESFNTDVWKWKSRIYDFGQGLFTLNFDKTLQKYHPGVTLMWLGSVGVKEKGAYCAIVQCPSEAEKPITNIFLLDFFQKLTVVLFLAFVSALTLFPLRRMVGKLAAFLIMTLATTEPFYYALSRELHLEGLATSLILSSLIFLVYAVNKGKLWTKPVAISAAFAGLAMLTKSSSLALIPFAVVFLSVQKKWKLVIVWAVVLVLTYFALWPSMWVQPVKTLDYVFLKGVKEVGVEGGHDQIFFGQKTSDPGALFYLLVFIFKSSPFLMFGIISFPLLVRRSSKYFDKQKAGLLIASALLLAAIYTVEIAIPTKKIDRYLVPTMALLAIPAGLAFATIIKSLKDMRTEMLGTVLTIFLMSAQIVSLSPDYLSYYNPFFGGLEKAVKILEPKWLIGQKEISRFVTDELGTQKLKKFSENQSIDSRGINTDEYLIVAFPEKYYTQIFPFIAKTGATAVIEDLTPHAREATYFIYPVWDDYSSQETRFKLEKYKIIKVRGVHLYTVYRRD